MLRQSTDGLPYLAPEIQLLYKSKDRRQRDDADFAVIEPLLPVDARRWLQDVLELVAPSARVDSCPEKRRRLIKRGRFDDRETPIGLLAAAKHWATREELSGCLPDAERDELVKSA